MWRGVWLLVSAAACGRVEFTETCTCDGNTLQCPSAITECAIACSTVDEPHCAAFIPSNGVDPSELVGTAAIDLAALTSFDTDTGAITGGVTRAAGPGVSAGIAFAQTANLGVFAFDSLTIESTAVVHFTGSAAAVFLVGTVLEVDGTIDASAGCYGTQASCAGPGGGSGSIYTTVAGGCGPGGDGIHDTVTTADSGGGGGGGGGSGASGGLDLVSGMMFVGGVGGSACIAATLEPLVGGGGGGGGGPGAAATATFGGGGGGALQLSALGSITIDGVLDAAGAGGEPGPTDPSNGGAPGGGGAGGAILIEAPDVTVNGIVAANGGGGGGGGATSSAAQPGQDGQASTIPAAGGGSASNGGSGGNGAAGETPPAIGDVSNGANSGGGGGGIGVVYLASEGAPTLVGTFSPPATTGAIASQ